MGLNQSALEKFNFLKDSFILDTGSTISATVMNEGLVTNIKKGQDSHRDDNECWRFDVFKNYESEIN